MLLSLIWAMTRNRVIGREQTLPWRLPKDMQFFQRTTTGHPVIMGRRTFESMKAPLPGRTNIVVTGQQGYERTGIEVAGDLDHALALAAHQCRVDGTEEAFVIGGARLYAEALPRAGRLYVTEIETELVGDTFFPPFSREHWQLLRQESHEADALNDYPFTISVLQRVQSP